MPRRSVADDIRQALMEAVSIAKGEADPSTYKVHIPAEVDPREIRKALGLSQADFAARYGFNLRTLQHWEQGLRVPDAATQSYFRAIRALPQEIAKALEDAAA